MVIRIITDDIRNIAAEAFDSLLQPMDDGGLAKPCLLVYPPRMTACSNCLQDPIGKKSANRYRHGGPIPFGNGICPACGGNGYFAQEESETLYLSTKVIAKKNYELPVEVSLPDGLLKVKGFLVDAPKLQRADYILHNTAIDGYLHRKYKKHEEIVSASNIVQNRYFTCVMIRV